MEHRSIKDAARMGSDGAQSLIQTAFARGPLSKQLAKGALMVMTTRKTKMGTRADFYAGKGKEAEWLGSIAWDGYQDGIPDTILYAHDEAMYRREVAEFLASRDDGTVPADGWPWPWDNSSTTDCSYWFFDGKCWDAHGEYFPLGDRYAPFDQHRPEFDGEEDEDEFFTKWLSDKPRIEYPDMQNKKCVTFGNRSGIIIVKQAA